MFLYLWLFSCLCFGIVLDFNRIGLKMVGSNALVLSRCFCFTVLVLIITLSMVATSEGEVGPGNKRRNMASTGGGVLLAFCSNTAFAHGGYLSFSKFP